MINTQPTSLKVKVGNSAEINFPHNKEFPRGRRHFISIVILVAVMVFLGFVWVNPLATKARTIGVLRYIEELKQVETGLYQGMENLGYKDGENIRYLITPYGESPQRMQALAQELVDQDVDLIVAITNVAASGAKKATEASGRTDIPIIFAYANTPDVTGLVKSFASSGNNLTGVAVNLVELTAKKLEFLKRISPSLKRVGILDADFTDPAGKFAQNELQKVAPQFGVEIVSYKVVNDIGPKAMAEIATLTEKIKPGDVDAFFYLPGPVSNPPQNAQLVIDMTRRLKISAVFLLHSQVERGGLFAYAHDMVVVGKQTATFVDKVLRGNRPSNIPVEFPEKNTLVINLSTARAIEITIPESLLNIADIKIGQ